MAKTIKKSFGKRFIGDLIDTVVACGCDTRLIRYLAYYMFVGQKAFEDSSRVGNCTIKKRRTIFFELARKGFLLGHMYLSKVQEFEADKPITLPIEKTDTTRIYSNDLKNLLV